MVSVVPEVSRVTVKYLVLKGASEEKVSSLCGGTSADRGGLSVDGGMAADG